MADKYQALREAAEKATPGPWEWDGRTVDDDGYVSIPECSYLVGLICLAGQYEDYQHDCDFMAAANPATIQALLAERDALREALDGIRQYGSDTLSGPAGELVDDRKWQRDAVIEMTKRARIALTK